MTFYSENVERETLSFPAGVLAHLLHIFEMIEEWGPALGKPYTAPLGEGLFEKNLDLAKKRMKEIKK